MSDSTKPGIRPWLHYVLEFVVILLGITVSVSLEKQNARQYKQELKNQSLSRILENLRYDDAEFEVNMEVHDLAAASCQWIFDHRREAAELDPDSLGHHCSICLDGQTIFVDNPEEYKGLRNSGLIELIEDSALVRRLQEKYIHHGYLHTLEDYNAEIVAPVRPLLYSHMTLPENAEDALDFITLRQWNGTPLPQSFFEFAQDASEWHLAYYWALEEQVEADAELRHLIAQELQ